TQHSNPSIIIEDLGETNATSFTWIVDVAAGKWIGFDVTDSKNALAQSAAVLVQPGSEYYQL
ncbi:hypothetical protein BDP27DRAFT_1242338, partial [Rhodocollybia butyracea]